MRKIILLILISIAACLVVLPAKAADNKYGVAVSQYYSEKGFSDSNQWLRHLDWASNMVGQGGYVKLFFPWIGDSDAPVQTYRQVVLETYARGLNPIVRIDGGWVNSSNNLPDLTGCWKRPPQDSDTPYSMTAGNYKQYSQKVVDFVDSLPVPPSGRVMYIELWNEMNYANIEWCDDNGNGSFEPENYARFYLEVYSRMNKLGKPNIKLTTGGLGRAGPQEFIEKMLSAAYEGADRDSATMKKLFEYYSIHVYPPTANEESFIAGIHNYNDQVKSFSKYGVDPKDIKILVTEGGYIKNNTSSSEDEKQARLDVEMVKTLNQDPRIVSINVFSLDDYTDKTISTLGSPLDSVLLVSSGSETLSGLPANPRPAYNSLRQLATGNSTTCQNCGGESVRPTGYAISEDLAAVNSIQTPTSYTSFPTTIDYTLQNQTSGLKVLYIKYFYSDGRTKIEQAPLQYEPVVQARVCNPGEVKSLCKQTQCTIGQQVVNPSDVLGVQVASSCTSGQTFYSCSDIKCPDGSIAPGGGCYPDNYLGDCLKNCPVVGTLTPIPTAALAPVIPPVSVEACPDECFSDELRLGVGRNANGQCDSSYIVTPYVCRAGSVGQQRACGGTSYVCVDAQSSGFYWSQLGSAPVATPVPALTPELEPNTQSGYQTTFKCNDQGTGWVCTSASPNSCTR